MSRWWPPRDVAPFDVGFALLMGLIVIGMAAVFPMRGQLLGVGRPVLYAVGAVLTVALVLRRRAPVAVSLLASALAVVYPGHWIVYAALYAAGAYARGRWLWLLVPVAIATTFVGGEDWVGFRLNDHAFIAFTTTLFALAGLYVGTRRALIAAATERADRAEREQELLAEQARAEERTRLAAEMHDVVTHRVNLMVLQAGAIGVTSDDPSVRDASETVRASGVTALAELRDLVGVLRSGADPGTAPTSDPTREEVTTLVAESRSVGVDVTLDEDGDPALLAPTVHRTLIRVVQEALTNVRKHAPRAVVRVEVHRSERGAVVAVVNDPPGRDPATATTAGSVPAPDADAVLAASGGGAGLDGLTRRVALVGGTLRAGPEPGGGFAVRAELPAYVPTEGSTT